MNKVIKYGDNVDTDVIIPARYLNTFDPKELARHCMEDLDAGFPEKVRKGGGVIAAGKNFGCGSSREHAPIALAASGVSLIFAESFARIFYRNAIDVGLAIVESPEAAREAREGDAVSFDAASGVLTNETRGRTYQCAPFPPFVQKIIAAGGLANIVRSGELK
jgi:3-isopropylmalate/(R)-2-methylmalate dehydratase small subunit